MSLNAIKIKHLSISTLDMSDQRWLAIKGASIFITGGSGLFGRWFIAALLDANHRLGTNITATILTRNPQEFLSQRTENNVQSGITFLQGNVLDFTFPEKKYSHVIHMATTSANETYFGEDSLAKFHLLVLGTERVMQFAGKCGAKKVLFTSSGVAYGAYPEPMQRVPESYDGAPNTMDFASGLGQGKRSAEFICAYYAKQYQFNLSIARCFSFIGHGLPLDIHYAIGNFIRDALWGERIIVKGDGSPMRSFLYLGDLVHWLLALLVDERQNRIYNVGSDQAVSILEVANLVKNLLAPTKPVVVLGDKQHGVGNFMRHWYVPDIHRAKSELGVDVWTPLDAAILHTIK